MTPMRLHPGPEPGTYVIYNDKGHVAAMGYLEVDDDGAVRFVNILTPVQVAAGM